MITTRKLPLLSTAALDTPIACWRDGAVSRAVFLRQVARVARQLSSARFILNLCEDRYRFMVAFAAVGVNGQPNLLPSNRAALICVNSLKIIPTASASAMRNWNAGWR